MRIYIDNSSLNRPFDDQSQPQIRLETVALLLILNLVENSRLGLVSSDILVYENLKSPHPQNRQWIDSFLDLAKHEQKLTPKIEVRALELEEQGLGAIDALHLASAEAAQADYFITSDDKILRKYEGSLRAGNPVQFIGEMKAA